MGAMASGVENDSSLGPEFDMRGNGWWWNPGLGMALTDPDDVPIAPVQFLEVDMLSTARGDCGEADFRDLA